MNFIEQFKDIIPYAVSVSVGGRKANMSKNSDNRSASNHKGKMYPDGRRTSNGFTSYTLAQDISLPINLSLVDGKDLTMFVEKTSQYTNKKSTDHTIRIFDSRNKQIGFVYLTLNAAGDVTHKTCFYENAEDTHNIKHTMYMKMKDGKLVKDENFEFEVKEGGISTIIEVSQRNGKIVGKSFLRDKTKTSQEIQFQSITDFTKDSINHPHIRQYVATNVTPEKDYRKRGGLLIPWECRTIEEDLLNYREQCDVLEDIKERHGDKLDSWWRLVEYCGDKNNDLYAGFKGDYIGNIVTRVENGYSACVVSNKVKDNTNFNLYTMLDIEGTDVCRGTGLDEYAGINRDEKYFEAVKTSDKTPRFVTKVAKDGSETLVLYKGQKAQQENCPEYSEFKSTYLAPLADIEHVSMGKILDSVRGVEK